MRSLCSFVAASLLTLAMLAPATAHAQFNFQPQYNPPAQQPDGDAVARAILNIIGAAVADNLAKPGREDGLLEDILRGVVRVGRDELVESAVKDVFPAMRPSETASVRRLISLGLDNKLNQRNWMAATARDELALRLQNENPGMAASVQVADFIAQVLATHQARR